MELLPVYTFCLFLVSCFIYNVEPEPISRVDRNSYGDLTGPRLLHEIQISRHKRHTPADTCTGNCDQQSATRASQVNKPQRNIIAYHYHHHYYYCCPSVTDHMHKHPHLAHASRHSMQGDKTHTHLSSSVDCSCDVAGSCSCSVQEKQASDNCGPMTGETKEPVQNAAFGFGMMLDNPIGKEFFDFITNNFVKKENAGKTNECQGSKTFHGFEDPVCTEFFNFFSQNFVRKQENQTPAPTQPPTPVPTQASRPGDNFQGEIKEFKTMFDSLKNEMKDTLSKTADIAKKMGMPMLR